MFLQRRPLLLASASPRRAQLLKDIGINFNVITTAIDEAALEGENPIDYTMRLAREKACAGRDAAFPVVASGDSVVQGAVVLGADTIVTLGGELLGKPQDETAARETWRKLGGTVHEVVTAVALADAQHCEVQVVRTKVWFDVLSEEDMAAYWASGEPQDKAGAYGIQGLGALFVSRIEGSYSGVVGLPLRETGLLLRDFAVV